MRLTPAGEGDCEGQNEGMLYTYMYVDADDMIVSDDGE